MGTYRTSNGERVTQKQIEARMRQAKQIKIESQVHLRGYNWCEKCNRNANGTRLDCSHTVSIDKAKKAGKTELCWSTENLEILCRDCHKEKDGLNLQFNENTNRM